MTINLLRQGIGAKLGLTSAIGLIMTATMLAAIWLGFRAIDRAQAEVTVEQARVLALIDAKASMRGQQKGASDLLLSTAGNGTAAALDYVKHRTASFDQYMQIASEHSGGPDDLARLQEIRALAANWSKKFEQLADVVAHKLASDGDAAALLERQQALRKEMAPLADGLATAVDASVKVAKERIAAATPAMQSIIQTALLSSLGVGAAMAVALLATALYGRRGIAAPIQRLTVSMARLADGDLAETVPFRERQDEIGRMATAVEVFKANGLRMRDLNRQEAALQAKSADLQASISTVVTAAADGDFRQRITKRYDNPDLDNFAGQVNVLVEAVDHGVGEVRRVVSALAQGDLTQTMQGDFKGAFGELKNNVNATMGQLQILMGEIRQAVESITSGASELSAASGDLSKRTEHQAASLEETSSALEEITVAVRNSKSRAAEVSHMADEAHGSTRQSGAVMREAVEAITRIDQASQEIGNIISVIDEIAFQTNLLALNAGIEAARAGESGKGFAVVAQEVRELAQRSAGAAKDIKTLISRSADQVQSGVTLVTSAGQAIGLIEDHMQKINGHIHAISTAASEQSSGLSQVSVAVTQMDQVTQQNAAMVEQSTASTSRLAEEATHLAQLVARFKLDNQGHANPHRTQRGTMGTTGGGLPTSRYAA
ncbi:methyl-accepting chemotaxis protein [Rhizobium rhizosphaerae]|uniref:Methyl-accepting chemotaxis protein n=1 Tax=Xaviernesmea rhizosphaerae TaxID=1672749 RepID=A0ABX3PAA1_9HYPH|nr:methyl-accepting chemotaxis protein [Xaviernesmea rhizosphaerae]OQP85383.1 methyl-accepting chemotaxis protein [Xaviernesmea rhizosphaerae]